MKNIKVLHLKHVPAGFSFRYNGGSYELHQWYPTGNFLYTVDHTEFMGDEYIFVDGAQYEKEIIKKLYEIFSYVVSIEKTEDGVITLRAYSDLYGDSHVVINVDLRPWEKLYKIQFNKGVRNG